MQTRNERPKEDRWWQRLLFTHMPSKKENIPTSLLVGGGLGLCATVFASVPLLFSVNPLALALLCAAEGQAFFWTLGGFLIGAWQSEASYWYVIGALIVLPLRVIARLFLTPPGKNDVLTPKELRQAYGTRLRSWTRRLFQSGGAMASSGTSAREAPLPPLFDEPIYLRAAASALAALIPALAIPIASGFAYYDLYGAVFSLAVTPTATTLFAILTSPSDQVNQDPRRRLWRLGGALLFIGALCLCGRSATVLGFSPIVLMGTLLCLLTIRRAGLGASLAISVVCGLCYDPITIPLFVLFSLIYALLRGIMQEVALLPATLGGMIYLLLCGDPSAFWQLMPSVIAGCLLFAAGRRLSDHIKAEATASASPVSHERELKQRLWEQEARHDALVRRLSGMSGAFSQLSEIFRQLEKNAAQPGAATLRQLCCDVFEKHCPDCPHNALCMEEQSLDLMTTLQSLSRALDEQGKVSEAHIESHLRSRCPHKRSILQDINDAMTRLSYESLRREGGAPFACECDEIAHLLRDTIRRDEQVTVSKSLEERREAVISYLKEKGLAFDEVVLLGRERLELRLVGLTPEALPLAKDQLQQDISCILKVPLSRARYDAADRGCLYFYSLPDVRADYVHRSLSCKQSTDHPNARGLCGDTLRVFVSDLGVFYALICDGMGKGRRAAITSGAAGVFLERSLRAGVEIQTALRMLNHYLISRQHSSEEEISSTIDLFALDLYTKKGYFLKSGAAPSLILREGRIFRLASHTLPIGILQAIDAQIIPFEVQPGDHILMMSDGVSDLESGEAADDHGDWLSEYLSGPLPEDDNGLICELFARARANGSCDDMSMVSIRISSEK